ncbi:hypothetical protein [Hirschia baltica]|uniref:Uncharacterized protein n=1 Tax=Hirschia baltica (strain ATCC 49814 / DSM 5838 / IFAM 1418) TaxID=582402 RepID=C6XMN9_HIRBI|nr:hypothetical protein [Hirschia baltica]ACT59953.1 hypothetical protein Hbal_2273 [Hirschia baltica ATCC 49814]
MIKISAKIVRGKNKGEELTPHLHKNGKYVASETRFKRDYIEVDNISDLPKLIKDGYKIRMSSASGSAPSLISPSSITIKS